VCQVELVIRVSVFFVNLTDSDPNRDFATLDLYVRRVVHATHFACVARLVEHIDWNVGLAHPAVACCSAVSVVCRSHHVAVKPSLATLLKYYALPEVTVTHCTLRQALPSALLVRACWSLGACQAYMAIPQLPHSESTACPLGMCTGKFEVYNCPLMGGHASQDGDVVIGVS
jgi:hypothetical protein